MDSRRGKVVLVTGGTSGIGRTAAEAFVRAGARVVIAGPRADHDAPRLETFRGSPPRG